MSSTLLHDLRRSLSRRTDGTVTLDDLRDIMGERSFGLLLLLSVLPTLVPLPLAGLLLGVPLLAVGVQMLLGFSQPWLPRWLLRRQMPQAPLLKLLDIVEPWWNWLASWSHPRGEWLVEGLGERLAGLFVVVLWVPVMAPLPLTNMLPAPALLLLALALLQRDGLLVLAAYLLGALVLGILTLIYGGLLALALPGISPFFGGM